MSNEEITNQDEVLEEVEQQDELVETPEAKVEEVQEDKMPSTKSGMIKALFDKVNGMKKEEVTAKYNDLMGVAEAEDLGGQPQLILMSKKMKLVKRKRR